MSVSRALVDCVVVSLQDTCLFYPCCRQCCSRTDVQQQDNSRCRCSRCGYICPREQVDHRYRLSLKVTRDSCIFGVTVFGACLNSFFGIHASGLQRLMETFDDPVGASSRSSLLVKAAEDCFIGRRFIFGIKISETESEPWLRRSANGSSRKDTVQLIASQMILPNAAGLRGCTVVSYYRALLHKAAEYERGSSDSSKTPRPPATTLLLIQPDSSEGNSINFRLSGSALSLQRSQSPDCTITPTPPWQQSLGLVTSSAEQEESCNTQDSADENNRQADTNKTPHHACAGSLDNHTVTEETTLSPSAFKCNSYNSPFEKYPYPSPGKTFGHSPILNTWSPPSPHQSSTKAKGLPMGQLTQTLLSSSLSWGDLPFSESLTEFVCEEHKDVDIVSEPEPHIYIKQPTESHNLCIDNTPALNRVNIHDLSQQVHKNAVRYENKMNDLYSHECNQEDEGSVSSKNKEEEQLEGDDYNCSADLFSGSFLVDTSISIHAETPAVNSLLSTPDKQSPSPVKEDLKNKTCINGDRLIPMLPQDVDFIPPSQSTPIGKASGLTAASSHRALTSQPGQFSENLPFFEGKNPAKSTYSLSKLHCANAHQLPKHIRESTKENLVWTTTSSRHSHRSTPKQRFWQTDKHQNHLLTPLHPRAQRRALNTGSAQRINHKFVLSDCEDNKVIFVPPTPVPKTQLSVKLSRSWRPDNSSSNLGSTVAGQRGDDIHSKRPCLDQTFTTSPQRGLVGTGHCDRETVDEGRLDGSSHDRSDDESQTCDWSRDLFSDSV